MTNTTTNTGALLRPADVDALFLTPMLFLSVAAQLCREVRIDSTSFRIPRILKDPQANWTAEAAEIIPDDMGSDEAVVTPTAVKGLSLISNELAEDSSPEAAEAVGEGLARSAARRVDEAFFTALPAPAPKGLTSLTGISAVAAPSAWANLDPFSSATAAAEGQGANVSAWVCSPTDALLLAQLKSADGSRTPLLTTDPAEPARRVVEGRPLYVSRYVKAGDVYGIDKSLAVLVVRRDATVVADSSPYFSSDRTAVRCVARVGFGFPQEAGLVRIRRAAAA